MLEHLEHLQRNGLEYREYRDLWHLQSFAKLFLAQETQRNTHQAKKETLKNQLPDAVVGLLRPVGGLTQRGQHRSDRRIAHCRLEVNWKLTRIKTNSGKGKKFWPHLSC